MSDKWEILDELLRPRLSDLDPATFERFLLHFLRAGIDLSIERNGQRVTKRVISAETYAAARHGGRIQKGIDLRVRVEGPEEWVFECKRHKKWDAGQTRKAIQKASSQYQAHHYFLVVACDPHEEVQDEMKKHPNWTFWNLDTICAELRLRVAPTKLPQVLFFLPPEELKRFAPFATEALIPPEKFFEPFLGADKLFRHDWTLVGGEKELNALFGFAAGPKKVKVVSAKGGDGKSRLLRELCQKLAAESPETQVLFLNPHSRDELSFSFLGNPQRRLFIVDDAHRTEQVPLQLLSRVREDPSAKIVLATRPQGVEALLHKLFEAGLADNVPPPLTLPSLKRPDVKMLAAEALGPRQAERAPELASLTADCPFLTVVAGGLLRQGRLQWGGWASDAEFRRLVFQEFEAKNFETIPEGDRDAVRGLIRLLALLAPVPIGSQFPERAARVLGRTPFQLETQLNRLRQSELVAGRDDGLRVTPDLFADFLVYATCYEPTTRMPAFTEHITREFADSGPALLRNLSEATWIARANGVSDESLLKPLVEQEQRRFEAACFRERGELLRHWSSFSVYLPAEALDLARQAVALKSAPPDRWRALLASRPLGSYDDVVAHVPALIESVAKYHKDHRHAALDLLWELGSGRKLVEAGGLGRDHPWATIAKVIRFEPDKRVEAVVDALAWLGNRLRGRDALEAFAAQSSVLRALIGPCFERAVEFTRDEGRVVHFCKVAVVVKDTRPIRDEALAILSSVIERGHEIAVLNALSALELAVWPINEARAQSGRARAELCDQWRPERLKALALLKRCITLHPAVTIRYKVRRILKGILVFEDDAAFAEECRTVLPAIPQDLRLRTAVILLSTASDEFPEPLDATQATEEAGKSEGRWNEIVRQAALELAERHPTPGELQDFLLALSDELGRAGNAPSGASLFSALAETAPALARGLAERLIGTKVDTPLLYAWPALLSGRPPTGSPEVTQLFQRGIQSPAASVSLSVIMALCSRARQNQPLSETEQNMLLEKAARPSVEEAFWLLDFVKWSGEANASLACRIMEKLPVREFAGRVLWQILDVLAPGAGGRVPVPESIVRKALLDLVDVPWLRLDEHGLRWDALIAAFPKDIYELVLRRVRHAASGSAPDDYHPVPTDFRSRFRIPGLVSDPEYARICEDLWSRASCRLEEASHWWVLLFQAVAFDGPPLWVAWMLRAVEGASSEEDLLWLARMLRFEGSLVVFRFPALTRAMLERARALGGEAAGKMRAELYAASGPQARMYSNGVLEERMDYVEAEAVKAAQAHPGDELLGPFYRWIAEVEQKDRLINKMLAEASPASLD